MSYLSLILMASFVVSSFAGGWFVKGNIDDVQIAELHKSYNTALQLQDEEIDRANLKAKQNEIDLHARYSKGLGVMWNLKLERERRSFARVKLFKEEKQANENLKDWSSVHHPNYVTEWLRGLSNAR